MKVSFKSDIKKIADICSGKITAGSHHTVIETVTSDSRDLGVSSLFIPLIGEKFDGHDFIKDLAEAGSINGFLTMKDGFDPIAAGKSVSVIKCEDTLKALGLLGAYNRERIGPVVVGVTGTNGKTTVKELIYFILENSRPCLKNEKNFNNEIGVPFTLLGLKEDHKTAVVEMGMNHPGELERLSMICRPDISVITNIGEGHLEFLGTIENVALAKAEILKGMTSGSLLLLNRDTLCFDIIREKALEFGIRLKTFGISENADIYPEEYLLSKDGIKVKYRSIEINVPLYGFHNIYNIMAAIGVAEEFDADLSSIGDPMKSFKNVEGRSMVIDRGYIIIDDTYNSNPLSSKYALESAGKIFCDRRKIAVLSDMKELGALSGSLHHEIGREVVKNGFQKLVVWGDMAGAYIEGAVESGMKRGDALMFADKNELIDYLNKNISESDVILIKGSRSMKMEEVVDGLLN